jgi:hypothetical protein
MCCWHTRVPAVTPDNGVRQLYWCAATALPFFSQVTISLSPHHIPVPPASQGQGPLLVLLSVSEAARISALVTDVGWADTLEISLHKGTLY